MCISNISKKPCAAPCDRASTGKHCMYEVCMYEVLLMRLLSTVGTDIYFMHLLSHGNDKLCRLPERQCTDNAYPHLLCHMFVLLEKMLSFVTLKMLAEHTLAVKHLGAPTLSPVKTDLIISPACPHIWMPADLQIKHAVCSGGTSFYLTWLRIDCTAEAAVSTGSVSDWMSGWRSTQAFGLPKKQISVIL